MNGSARSSAKLIVQDFLPNRLSRTPVPQHTCVSVEGDGEHETFPDIIDKANSWLKDHPNFFIQSCETVDFKLQDGEPRTVESTFWARGERPNCYMRGLRLWLKETFLAEDSQARGQAKPEQIGYFNVLPKWKTADLDLEEMTDMQSERLSEVVTRLNGMLRVRPLNGSIFAVHTFSIKFTKTGPLPDRAVWKDRGYAKQFFLVGLRVFFVHSSNSRPKSNPQHVTFSDHLPKTLHAENPYVRHPKVESFPAVLQCASSELSHLPPHTRLLNLQTLHLRQDFLQPIDSDRSHFCEDNIHSYHLKFLRLWYISDRNHSADQLPKLSLQRSLPALHCQLFCPILYRKPGLFSNGRFESQPQLQSRLLNWIDGSGVKVAGVETLIMRLFSGAENFEGFGTMHTWNRVIHHSNAAHSHRHNFLHGRTHHRHGVRHCESSAAAETFVTVYRVYYFGHSDPDFELSLVESGVKADSLEEFMLARSRSSCCILV